MIRRLWLGITWPACIGTCVFGGLLLSNYSLSTLPQWLEMKLYFVSGLLIYHLWLHQIYRSQKRNEFTYSSQSLRIINEIATIFLVVIVFLVELKSQLNLVTGFIGLIMLTTALWLAINIFKRVRQKNAAVSK